jgi:hypothetical protein
MTAGPQTAQGHWLINRDYVMFRSPRNLFPYFTFKINLLNKWDLCILGSREIKEIIEKTNILFIFL